MAVAVAVAVAVAWPVAFSRSRRTCRRHEVPTSAARSRPLQQGAGKKERALFAPVIKGTPPTPRYFMALDH